MDITSAIFSIVAAVSGVSAILFGAAAYRRANKHEAYKDGNRDGELLEDVKYLRKEFDELRFDIREVGRRQENQIERLIRCEENAKAAHRRLDEINAKNGGG
ncbi:MAG: hypothetical protein LBS99_06350 [Clostridiales bacterium]|jgi:hypothetical protein|nr:hypothetical protein [Clostridiales bacterium]